MIWTFQVPRIHSPLLCRLRAKRNSLKRPRGRGYVFVLAGFVTMLLLWGEGSSYWVVALGYVLVGIGVGFAGTPASRSLTGSVPVTRAGMASGTADLQRDLGGAVMQSIFGALLTAGYATAAAAALADAPPSADFTTSVQNQLTMSFAGAADIAQQYPQYSTQILQAAKESFLAGDQWAYLAGIVAVLLGAALVFLKFPHRDEEHRLLAQYHDEDNAATPSSPVALPNPAAAYTRAAAADR